MNRIPLCLLLASLAYPASGQSPIFFRGSAPQYDMEKHPPTGEKLVPFSTADAAANTANWNAINDKIHMATGGIREDVTLPAGRWYHNGTLRIGINAAETQVRAGGCITVQGAGEVNSIRTPPASISAQRHGSSIHHPFPAVTATPTAQACSMVAPDGLSAIARSMALTCRTMMRGSPAILRRSKKLACDFKRAQSPASRTPAIYGARRLHLWASATRS